MHNVSDPAKAPTMTAAGPDNDESVMVSTIYNE